MAATLMAVNERAHVDLNDAELGAEPAILGATDCPFFLGPGGEQFTVATSLVGSRTFPSWLRAMRRAAQSLVSECKGGWITDEIASCIDLIDPTSESVGRVANHF